MRKLFFILFAALSLMAIAQSDVKRVAILETVDKMGTVPYMKQLMFRSNLTTAITNTSGYEGYDRADLKEILGEQNFQRTGLVSDADIKKIGEFTGAKYVLIAEAVIDGSDMFITAKIIDVETARVLRNSNQLMGLSAAEMQSGSQKVAADLLGVSLNNVAQQTAAVNTPAHQATVTQTPAPQFPTKTSSKVPAATSAPAPAVSTVVSPVSRDANEYVDLGLPSGTKWKASNESCGQITYSQAMSMYDKQVPSKEQWEELKKSCIWVWTGSGYNVTGPNNETIYFPAEGASINNKSKGAGSEGIYWSSTQEYSARAYFPIAITFTKKSTMKAQMWAGDMHMSIRLVR